MSIHLFNAEIDMALAQLDPEVGTEVGAYESTMVPSQMTLHYTQSRWLDCRH